MSNDIEFDSFYTSNSEIYGFVNIIRFPRYKYSEICNIIDLEIIIV